MELPGVQDSCEKHLAIASKVLLGCAQLSSVPGTGVGRGQGSIFPGVLWSCWGPLGALRFLGLL